MHSRVLVTGSNGLLGQKLVNRLAANSKFHVIAISKGVNRNETAGKFQYFDLDITDKTALNDLVRDQIPDFIFNCAAMTNVDQCETEKEQCDLINVGAVKTLVELSKELDIHLIHISTDFIFDGEDGPYTETDIANPLSYYGLSKLRSEELVLNSGIKATILRTILVYGLVDNMTKGNIVLYVKNALENKKVVTIVDDQWRMPTLVDDLAQACISAMQQAAYGIYNVSSSQLLSIYEMALQIAEAFELDSKYIKRIATSQLSQAAKRPPKTGFDLTKSQKVLNFPVAPFKKRLQVFKNQLAHF